MESVHLGGFSPIRIGDLHPEFLGVSIVGLGRDLLAGSPSSLSCTASGLVEGQFTVTKWFFPLPIADGNIYIFGEYYMECDKTSEFPSTWAGVS